MNYFLIMLRNCEDRDQLALTWKVFAACAEHFPDRQWIEARDAFKARAKELGLEWLR